MNVLTRLRRRVPEAEQCRRCQQPAGRHQLLCISCRFDDRYTNAVLPNPSDTSRKAQP